MSFHSDWWTRAEDILIELKLDFIRGKYLDIPTDLKTEAIDKLQLELKENDILATEHLKKPRIDMAQQLIDCVLNKGEAK